MVQLPQQLAEGAVELGLQSGEAHSLDLQGGDQGPDRSGRGCGAARFHGQIVMLVKGPEGNEGSDNHKSLRSP